MTTVRRSSPLAVLILFVTVVGTATAVPGPTLVIRGVSVAPGTPLIYRVLPGSITQGEVEVANTGTANTPEVKLYPADATTGRTTGAVYLTNKKPRRAGAWISVSQRLFPLAAGERHRVRFTIRVPTTATSGDWVAGIVAETNRPSHSLAPVMVQINVAGKQVVTFVIGAVTLSDVNGAQQLTIPVGNAGNVVRRPRGVVTLYDVRGKPVRSLRFTMDRFLPGTTSNFPIVLHQPLERGTYRALVSLATGTGQPTTGTSQFTVAAAPAQPTSTETGSTTAPTTTAPATTPATTTTTTPRGATTVTAGPSPQRDDRALWFLMGGLAGAATIGLAGLVVAPAWSRRRKIIVPEVHPEPASVSAPEVVSTPVEPPEVVLERQLADLERRASALHQIAAALSEPEPEVALPAPAPPEEPPALEPEPEPLAPEPSTVPEPDVSWLIADVERIVEAAYATSASNADELGYYAHLLRAHVDTSGVIPPEFNELLEDVFGGA